MMAMMMDVMTMIEVKIMVMMMWSTTSAFYQIARFGAECSAKLFPPRPGNM